MKSLVSHFNGTLMTIKYVSKDTLSGLQLKQMILFPERFDKNITENAPVCVVDTVIDNLNLENFRKFLKSAGAVHTIRG